MPWILERVLLVLFTLVRVACLMQGLALLSALVAGPGAAQTPWLRIVLDGALVAGAILTATGIALVVAGRMEPVPASETPAGRATWPAALGFTLVLLAAVALVRSESLLLLWQHVSALLDQAGFREELARGGQGSGLVMLPILVALLVPILETVTTFFLVVAPLLMLGPLAGRSPRFPALFAMLVATQAGLAICSYSASSTLAAIVAEATRSMQASGDAEVLEAAGVAAALLGRIEATARGFVLPVVGHLVWLPFLLRSAARRWFAPRAPGDQA